MDKSYNVINEFLNNPQNTDSLYESDTVIAIDWREDDEDIVQYFNHAIGYKISVQMGNNDKHYGKDIILTYKEKTVKIPYEEKKDRDTTIIWINERIFPYVCLLRVWKMIRFYFVFYQMSNGISLKRNKGKQS